MCWSTTCAGYHMLSTWVLCTSLVYPEERTCLCRGVHSTMYNISNYTWISPCPCLTLFGKVIVHSNLLLSNAMLRKYQKYLDLFIAWSCYIDVISNNFSVQKKWESNPPLGSSWKTTSSWKTILKLVWHRIRI